MGVADESRVNERLPYTAAELEQHWQLDCQSSLKQLALWVQQQTNSGLSISALKDLQQFQNTLTKCAFIHSTPNTERYSNCPDYYALVTQIKAVRIAIEHAPGGNRPEAITQQLQALSAALVANRCPATHP